MIKQVAAQLENPVLIDSFISALEHRYLPYLLTIQQIIITIWIEVGIKELFEALSLKGCHLNSQTNDAERPDEQYGG